jgi:hypothetical protein
MTEFKEGDEVLVKAKFVSRGEHLNEGLAWLKGGVTNADDFVAHITDIIPAPALDVNKELLEALKKLRAAFAFSMKIRGKSDDLLEAVLSPADEAIAAAEKGALEDAIAAAEEVDLRNSRG